MSSLSDLRLARIAVIGVLAATLGLAGCGRKGALDPPPGAAAAEAKDVPPDATPERSPNYDPNVPPAGPKRRLPIDILID